MIWRHKIISCLNLCYACFRGIFNCSIECFLSENRIQMLMYNQYMLCCVLFMLHYIIAILNKFCRREQDYRWFFKINPSPASGTTGGHWQCGAVHSQLSRGAPHWNHSYRGRRGLAHLRKQLLENQEQSLVQTDI